MPEKHIQYELLVMAIQRKNGRTHTYLTRGSLLAAFAFSFLVGLILTSTRPETIGLLGVMSFFLVLYGALFSLILFAYSLKKKDQPLSFRGVLKGAVLALAPVMLIALSSTSPLGFLDVLLVLSFQLAAQFYVNRVA